MSMTTTMTTTLSMTDTTLSYIIFVVLPKQLYIYRLSTIDSFGNKDFILYQRIALPR